MNCRRDQSGHFGKLGPCRRRGILADLALSKDVLFIACYGRFLQEFADLAAVAKLTQACAKSAARTHISRPAASLRRHARPRQHQITYDVGHLDERAGAGSLMIG